MLKDIPLIKKLELTVFDIPTDFPESDGTLEWDHTTMVLVEIEGGGQKGLGYTYSDASIGYFIEKNLSPIVRDKNCFDISAIHAAMVRQIRNDGNTGIAAMAVSAVDCALWDLKARLLALPLAVLLGLKRKDFPIYGSGGFTSYPIDRLQSQLAGWVEMNIPQVKMKVGRDKDRDLYRVKRAREAIGNRAALFVDANGAYAVKEALNMAMQFSVCGVSWFEEPVPSVNLRGLSFIRDHAPEQMVIAAGEYGDNLMYFENMLGAQAVDVLQADITRCGGLSVFLKIGHLCEARQIPYSSHCAPSLHVHAGLALAPFYTGEYFYDHARIEQLFFDGAPRPEGGVLHADLSRPGLGLELKKPDVERYRL